MAANATICKAELRIADIDRNYYRDHALTLARHPSETDERMMVRLLAFALHAHEALVFGRGLSTQDEPDLWQKKLNGEIALWIDVGQPDARHIRRACRRAARVVVVSYGGRGAELWWSQQRGGLERLPNLTVISLLAAETQALARLAGRSMRLQCNIQEGQVSVLGGSDIVLIEPATLLAPAPRERKNN